MKYNLKIIALLSVVAFLVIIVAAVSFRVFTQIEESSEARRHTNEVIGRADGLLTSLISAETGERGYLLTGDTLFLYPYLTVRDSIGHQMMELSRLTKIDSARTHIQAIKHLVELKMAEISRLIEYRRFNKVAIAAAMVKQGEGKRLMNAIRTEITSFDAIESAALEIHESEFQSNLRELFTVIIAASLLMLLLALSFAVLIYRETRHKLKQLVHNETVNLLKAQEETNKQLQWANFNLQISEEKFEVTLNSIGDAVIATDAEGCVTILNPLAEQLTGWTLSQASGHPVEEIFHIINQETRKPAHIPIKDVLAHGTKQGLANHTILISRGLSECSIADSCAPIIDRDGKVVGAVLVFRDVTKEYEIQKNLQESEDRARKIFDESSIGVMTVGRDFHFLRTNFAFQRMLGYSNEELQQLTFRDITHPEHLQKDILNVNKIVEGSLPVYETEKLYRRKDGEYIWGNVKVTLHKNEKDEFEYLLAMVEDINERKAAENKLKKAGSLQNAIFNSANFSSIATDAKGVIQIFNVGAERMLGYSAAEVMNKITPADISDAHEVIARAKALSIELSTEITPGFEALVFKAKRGIEDIYELTYIRKDGSRFPAVVSVTALRDEQNIIIGYLLIGTDNTARKQIEAEQRILAQKLRDHQFYTRSLFEANIDALMTTDPSGIITDVNKQMEVLTDCTRDELIGAPFKNYFTDPERAQAGINQVLSEKKVTNYELTARTQNGKETIVSYNATTFFDRDRKLQGVFAAARDVTDRKQFDQVMLEKNVELEKSRSVSEKANLAKSNFLSSMSHELRSPLNAILGFAQLMQSSVPGPTKSQIESIKQILQAGWHLLKLINEVLDLAVVESGKVSLSQEPVSLGEVISECEAMFVPEGHKRNIKMIFPEFYNPMFVMADRTRLKQVFINLLSNAIKYNHNHGMVEVKCTASTPEHILISIKDTGPGMTPEQMKNLFQPFNRLGQENGGIEGTGIGLSTSKRLVELMGGLIGVQSNVGTGSVFWFEMLSADPVQIDDVKTELIQALPTSGAMDGHQSTLLYVEDNPANMKLVEELIGRRPDLRLLRADNGNLGVELAVKHLPDVILMDINLPGISGVQALKLLHEDTTTRNIPVVALSANAMPRDIKSGLDAGFFRYLTKPIKVNEFMNTLNEALSFSAKGKTRLQREEEAVKA